VRAEWENKKRHGKCFSIILVILFINIEAAFSFLNLIVKRDKKKVADEVVAIKVREKD
jgi:hypothetical protein